MNRISARISCLGFSLTLGFLLGPTVLVAAETDTRVNAYSKTGEIIRQAPGNGGVSFQEVSHAQDEVLVRFRSARSESAKAAVHTRIRATRLKRFRIVRDLDLVKLSSGVSVEDAIKSYRNHPDVLYAEPNYIVRSFGTPDDPFLWTQWNLNNTGQGGGTPGADIQAVDAWNVTTGSGDVVVAIVDTGIDYNHKDLAANVWRNEADCNNNGVDDDGNGYADDCHGIDTFNNDSDPMDDENHGTHVAGIIGAVGNNAVGMTGVSWRVKLMPCKFMGADGYGYLSGVIACLEYVKAMKERGVNIIASNNSWGGGGYSQALYDAIDAHRQLGILFVAAAGNHSFDNDVLLGFPATYHLANVISVTATDRFDNLAFFSDVGRRTVHIGAPGAEILSTAKGNTYRVFSGTSMAAPHVSGTAALLKAQDPTRDWKSIKNLLLAGGDPIASLGDTITQKRLNAYGSMTCSNSVVLSRLEPVANALTGHVGSPIDLRALHINCASPNGDIDVRLNPGNQIITLSDNGSASDQSAGDGIYSGQWTPSTEGTYTLTFPDGDVVAVRVISAQTHGLFRPYVTFPIGPTARSFPEAVAIGDVNGDGRNDVVMTTSWDYDPENDNHIYVFLQNASGQLEGPVKYPVCDCYVYHPIAVAIGDVNNDGRADIVIDANNAIGVFYQNASGGLDPIVTYASNRPNLGNPNQVQVADLNNDGLLDVVISGGDGVEIFFQNPNGTLDPPVGYDINYEFYPHHGLRVGDVNNDGLNDIVVLGQGVSGSPGIGVLYQKIDGTFKPAVYYDLGETYVPFAGSIAVGDVNNDGLQDVVMTYGGNVPSSFFAVFLQNEAGTLNPPVNYRTKDIPIAVQIADINNDGRNDVIVSHLGWYALDVHLQASNGDLFPADFYFSTGGSFNPQAMAVGDINGDGLNDVVLADRENNTGRPVVVAFYNDLNASRITRTITLYNVSGNGRGTVVSSPPGFKCSYGSICTAEFPYGLPVTLTGVPEPGSILERWTWEPALRDGCSHTDSNDCTIMVNHEMDVNAYFTTSHPPLRVSKPDTGNGMVTSNPAGINCGLDCEELYAPGTVVTLNAAPDLGSIFDGWGGNCGGLGSCVVTVVDGTKANNEVWAYFRSIIRVVNPVPGTVWRIGSKQTIFWSAAQNGSNMPPLQKFRLDLSRDGGVTWVPIVKKMINALPKIWKVTGPATSNAKFRVCSISPFFCATSESFVIQ